MKVPLLAGWTALALIATGFSQDKATLITQLRAAAEAELQASAKQPDSKSPERFAGDSTFKRAVSQLELMPSDAPNAHLRQAVAGIHSTSSSEATRKAAAALSDFLRKEVEEQREKLRSAFETTAKRVAEIGLTATTAKELDAPIAELTKLMTGLTREAMNPEDRSGYSHAQQLQPLLQWLQGRQEYLIQMEAGDRKAALQALQRRSGHGDNLALWIPRSRLLAQQAADLKAATPSPEKAQEELQARIRKVTELCRQVLSTDDPKAIDPVVDQLTDLQKFDYTEGDSIDRQRAQQAVSSAREFVRRWQDFLIARAAGDREAARTILSEFTRGGREYPGVPRSEILARAYGEQAAAKNAKPGEATALSSPEQLMEQMTTLEAMERLLPELESAARTSNNSQNQMTLMAIQEVARAYRDHKAGNATRVSLNLSGQFGDNDGPVNKLRNELALLVLPSLIGVEQPDYPKAGETPLTYLRRMLNTARERKEWLLAQRIMTTAQSTGVNDPLIRSADGSAITQFLSGVSLEKGRQFALAVNAYQLALKAGSELLPAEEIGSRLEAIKKSHPEAYEAGTELTMNPPAPRGMTGYPYGAGGPGMRSPYPPGHPMNRDYTGAPRGEQPVVVPAKPQNAPAATPPTAAPAAPATPTPTTEKPEAKPADAKNAPTAP